MNNTAKYRQHLKEELSCSYQTKKKLLKKFDTVLNAYLADFPAPDEVALDTAFGPPQEMAKILMNEVSEKEMIQHKVEKRFKKVVAILIIISWIFFTVYVYFQKEIPVTIIGEGYYENIPTAKEEMP